MANKREKRRFSALVDNKNLEREETKSLNNITSKPEVTIDVVAEDAIPVTPLVVPVPKEVVFLPKRIPRNYNFDGELLEKFDALIWDERLTASDTIHSALKTLIDSIAVDKMQASLDALKASKVYKGKDYYYKIRTNS
jgi:hypothetical protein